MQLYNFILDHASAHMRYLGTEIDRWRTLQHMAFDVQGPMHNICLHVGSSIGRTHPAAQPMCYRLFRYITMAHVLMYRGINDTWRFTHEAFAGVSLLQGGAEKKALRSLKNEAREGMDTWVANVLQRMMKKELLPKDMQFHLQQNLSLLRGRAGGSGDKRGMQPPISETILMRLLVLVQVLLFTAGFAGKWASFRAGPGYYSHSDVGNQWACEDTVQPFFASCIVNLVFSFQLSLACALRNPFDNEFDDINPNVMVQETMRICWHNLNQAHLDLPEEEETAARGGTWAYLVLGLGLGLGLGLLGDAGALAMV
jgi:hypothetical protein